MAAERHAVRRAAKTDRNQGEIIAALRAVGASVRPLHMVGQGFPDLAVGFRGGNYFLEVKAGAGTLTPDELEFQFTWRGAVAIVRSVDEALSAIGAVATGA